MPCLKPLQPIEISNIVNDMPFLTGQVSRMNLFSFKGAFTNTVAIDRTDYTPGLIPASPWCCDAKVTQGSPTRNLFPVEIPHAHIEDVIWACDLSGVRGQTLGLEVDYTTVAAERAKTLMRMRMNIDTTMEFRKLGALKGQVLDANGTNVLLDVYKLFGTTQQTQDIPLGTAGADIVGAFREATRKSITGARSFRPIGWRVLAGKNFFDKLVSHPSLVDMYKRCCDTQARVLGDASNFSFEFLPGISVMEYWADPINGDVDFIGPDEAIMFPIVGPGVEMYEMLAAPPATLNFVNTKAAQEYYFWEKLICERDENDAEGLRILGEFNLLPIVKHPAAIIRLNLV
jgi:hypothetical protein